MYFVLGSNLPPYEIYFKNLAIETAEKAGVVYVLAQDPDSDRFTAAERRCSNLYFFLFFFSSSQPST